MLRHSRVCRLAMMAALLLTQSVILFAQEGVDDSLYWEQDTTLQQRIDTLGIDVVTRDIQAKLKRTQKYLAKPESPIPTDSVDTWLQSIRWAVILRDPKSLSTLNMLVPMVQNGSRGNWQYYFATMTIWGAFEAETSDYPLEEKSHVILDRVYQGTELEINFYEERLLDLGAAGVPYVTDWVRRNLLPRITELDLEKLSEEDLAFPRLYDRFVVIFAAMVDRAEAISDVKTLLEDSDLRMRRFAQDVLDASG